MAELLPSTVDMVVKWAKANDALKAVFGTNVSTALPKEGMEYPWLQAQRIIGESIFPDVPIDRARIQFNVWGGVRANGMPDWAPADLGVRTLESEVREFVPVTIDGAVIVEMTGLEGMMQLQDPDTNEARFWMDAIVIVRNA